MKFRDDSGVALLWTAIFIGVFAVFMAIAIDMGFMSWTGEHLQIGADGASLGGALLLRTNLDTARDVAQNVGVANYSGDEPIQLNRNDGNAAGGDIVFGRYRRTDGTFTPTMDSPNAVQVAARRTSGSLNGNTTLVFGPLYNAVNFEMQRDAIAMIKGGIGAGVVALDPDSPCALDMRGTAGFFEVNNGAIYVDSDHPDAACHSGQPEIDAEEIYIAGDTDHRWENQVDYTGELYTDENPIGDPLANLPEPNWNPVNDLGGIEVDGGATITVNPGVYLTGFVVRNGTLIVNPGVYILGELDINGGNFVANQAPGVMFYIVEDGPGSGNVDIRGNGVTDIVGLTPISYPDGPGVPAELADIPVPIFQARDNDTPSRILGTSNFSLEGTIYMPNNHLEIGGESENFANGLVANTLQAHGNGTLAIDYQGQFQDLPIHVWLVE